MGEHKLKKQRMHKTSAWVLQSEGQVARCVLPDGKRFVFLMRGHSPQVAPMVEQGEYEVDASLLPGSDTSFPMAVIVIDAAHVVAWQNVTVEQVSPILDGFIQASAPETRQ